MCKPEGSIYRVVQNYSCLFENSRSSAARQHGQPMRSQSANFGKFKLNSHNLAGIFLHHSVLIITTGLCCIAFLVRNPYCFTPPSTPSSTLHNCAAVLLVSSFRPRPCNTIPCPAPHCAREMLYWTLYKCRKTCHSCNYAKKLELEPAVS